MLQKNGIDYACLCNDALTRKGSIFQIIYELQVVHEHICIHNNE